MTRSPGDSRELRLFRTPEHPCSYLPGLSARTLFPDPQGPMDVRLYSTLINFGFRRSGDFVYRPDCKGCSACIPVRVPVDLFQPRRRHRRIIKKNRDLRIIEREAGFHEEHYALFRRYIAGRHGDGDMSDTSETQYCRFLLSDWCDTRLFEFRDRRRLVAVAVTDRLTSGLSSFYTFFDPSEGWRSPGTLSIVWQIGETRRQGLSSLYLGYWIERSRKMAYKTEFRPIEMLVDRTWQRFDPGEPIPTQDIPGPPGR